jgi:ATP-dependent RNA helicase DDX23/PRP28
LRCQVSWFCTLFTVICNPTTCLFSQPLSLEQLLKNKQEEQAALSKPVFLTKQQRAEAALQKLQDKTAAYRASTDAQRLGLAAGSGAVAQPSSLSVDRQGRDRGHERGVRDREHSRKEERERARELELIKQQYLGAEKKKKKIAKATERFKFVFDWDASEDTSRDLNPLYQNSHGK